MWNSHSGCVLFKRKENIQITFEFIQDTNYEYKNEITETKKWRRTTFYFQNLPMLYYWGYILWKNLTLHKTFLFIKYGEITNLLKNFMLFLVNFIISAEKMLQNINMK